MKINYNDWFYNYHNYLKGKRNGVKSFNDTKWIDMNKRFNSIMSINPNLIDNQPFGVISNDNGFEKLIELMSKSNYTFEDINSSLINTYQMCLRNSMSRMMVNTHSVIFKCNNMDKDHVSSDKYSGYYIVDVPFNQLHFGDRDEFIRQRLHKMHTTENDYYVNIDDFITGEFSDILGFTILCTINGFICNDCKVAISDKGFKFKIRWGYSSDVDFIIYKLDEAFICKSEVDVSSIFKKRISYKELGINNLSNLNYNCLVNIYDNNFKSTVPSVPNFGEFDDYGLTIKNLQNRTIRDIEEYKTNKVTVIIYALKYIKEVPNVYPAINYYDIIDTRLVLTDKNDKVKNYKNERILSSDTNNVNLLEICTPPITLDRQVNVSFEIITSCLNMYDKLITFNDVFKTIGKTLQLSDINESIINQNIIRPVNEIYDALIKCYITYTKGAILTSLVPDRLISKFKKLIDSLNNIRNLSDVNKIELYVIDEFYYDNYEIFVNEITKPFKNEKLDSFKYISKLPHNYFCDDNHESFMRPVSEQCFISLRYHKDEECWLFDYPNIKRFNGIGNVFYIDDELNGDEIFKFFVLYTDTESIPETSVSDLTQNQILDFDLFCKEVNKHIGYVRYWQTENKLMKLSNIICDRYDDDKVIQILSKILKNKLDGFDIRDMYPSNINYEPSNITSDNIHDWDTNTDRAPFSVNFLFYTLSMLNGNEDKLQSYFYNNLTSNKFNNRYSDIDISKIFNNQKKYPINFSKISVFPETVDIGSSNILSNNNIMYGLPYMINSDGDNIITPYTHTFNVCTPEFKFDSLKDNSEYISFNDPEACGYETLSNYNDIYVCKLVTYYLNYLYDYISELQTNYTKSYNQTSLLESCIETIEKHISDINEFVKDHNKFTHPNTSIIIDSIVNDNEFLNIINRANDLLKEINECEHNKRIISNIKFFNDFMKTLKSVYTQKGFDNVSLRYIKNLYDHLKRINRPLNPYQYKKWLNDVDDDIMNNVDSVLSNNDSLIINKSVFKSFYNSFIEYRESTIPLIDELMSLIDSLSTTLRDNHINILSEYCDDIINNYNIDLFIISDINFNKDIKYTSKPFVIKLDIPSMDIHINNHNDVSLIFYPETDINDNSYIIKSISKICEYAFFSGEKMNSCNVSVIDESGSIITNIDIDISLIKIGNLFDSSDDIFKVSNIDNTCIDIQNTHESLCVNGKGEIISTKHTEMNYELLLHNHFIPLNHEIQKICEDTQNLQGPVDRIYIHNQIINNLIDDDYKNHSNLKMHFKPSQVMHIPLDESGNITSIGNRYHVGQHLYLKNYDNSYIFPIIITAIDHSSNKGFIEAIIDKNRCDWFNISDKNKISEYLKSDIECFVIDDNMCNLLNEFNNPSFVYYKMNEIINEFNNKNYDDDIIYLGDSYIDDDRNIISIKMINHNMNTFTNPEMYPILREEPNDHTIWDREIEVFKQQMYSSNMKLSELNRNIALVTDEVRNAKTENDRQNALMKLDNARRKLDKEKDFFNRIKSYSDQLESPTTWYNVRSYDDTLVYIDNGRAKLSFSHICNIRDIPFTDKTKILLYDWEHDNWVDPNSYYVETVSVDSVKIDEVDNYKTNNIIHSIIIKTNDGFINSKKILIYLSHKSNETFNTPTNECKCKVRFKPLLSIPDKNDNVDIYNHLKIRKHFDGFESYSFKKFNSPNDFSIKEAFHVKRINRSGKYNYPPQFMFSDISAINNDTFDFDIYIRNAFIDVSTDKTLKSHQYESTIHHNIDNFTNNERVKLICIQNNDISSYNGNISNIMFEGLLKYNESGNQTIDILNSSLSSNTKGSFICTVFRDQTYSSFGGIISINVSIKEDTIFDSNNSWIKISDELFQYKQIPNEFILVPKNDINFEFPVDIVLQIKYERNSNDIINKNNINNNPREYYYNRSNNTRLPISNIRCNKHYERLVIDNDINPDIELIKSTYIGICRYSKSRINDDGFIDLTGYIPTPLSRDRYEFWINGKQIIDNNEITILSPTTIQLSGLKSLRNFEVIELVDDILNNDIFPKGNIYIDLNGNVYDSYLKSLKSNQNIMKQDIRFTFNQLNHKPLHDYSNGILNIEKNYDIENDILDSIKLDNSSMLDYNNMTNIPSINGIPIYHPMLHDLGIIDIDDNDITDMFDSIWKKEIITNPLFINIHREKNDKHNNIDFSITDHEDYFSIFIKGYTSKYFTIYISKNSYSNIDDVENTLKIIPFVKSGTSILIDKSYRNMWIHSTLNHYSKRIR